MKLATLVVLSYNRKAYFERSIQSLFKNTTAPYELIVCDDASDKETRDYIYGLVDAGMVSTAMFNTHHNRGIGVAVNRAFRAASGQYLLKLDADLEYNPGWLEEVEKILDHPEVGACGLFAYWHEPCHFDKMLKATTPDYHHVVDFVGSATCLTQKTYESRGPWLETRARCFSEDMEYKDGLVAAGYRLVLPLQDLASNFGFGEQHTSLIKKIDWEHGKHEYNIPTYAPVVFIQGRRVTYEPAEAGQAG